jgi:hypothetical protein
MWREYLLKLKSESDWAFEFYLKVGYNVVNIKAYRQLMKHTKNKKIKKVNANDGKVVDEHKETFVHTFYVWIIKVMNRDNQS